MKLLHLSDLHFGKSLFEYSLIEDQRYWCGQVLAFLRENPHDAVIIAGDLYDRSVPSSEAVELMDGFLTALVQELRLPVLAISGNHDGGKRLGFGSGLYRGSGLYMAAVPQAEIERVTLTDAFGAVDFWLLPYLSPADGRTLFPEKDIHTFHDTYRVFLEENMPRMDKNRRNVLVAHGFFSGFSQNVETQLVTSDSELSIGGADITDTALFAGFQYCALGHLHAPQRAGGETIRYCGSPLKYSVSEEHQRKRLLSVTLDAQGNVTFAETELAPLHRLYSVEGSLEQLSAPTGGEMVSEDYVFVNILTDGAELAAAQRIRNLYPNYLGIRYRTREEATLLLGGGEAVRRRSLPEAFDDFYQSVTGRELTSQQRQLVTLVAEETREGEEP
ncbi:MAG: exonuclease SbcCD subunit D [Angelakisella sp.]